MRRRLVLLTAATTSMVAIAFVVPLLLLVRSLAEERAYRPVELAVQGIAPIVGTRDPAAILDAVDAAQGRLDTPVAVTMPDGTLIGSEAARHVGPAPDVLSTVDAEGISGGAEEPIDALVILPVVLSDGTAVVSAAVEAHQVNRGVPRASWALVTLGVVLVGGAVLVADRFARRTLDVVDELEAVALLLSDGRLETRVEDDPASPEELARVGSALNTLASRIGVLLDHEREVAADLSHRLRTPMTAMRLQVDSLEPGPQRSELMDALARLQASVDQVISDARRPVREGAVPRSDLDAVARERVGFWLALAEDEDRDLHATLPGEPAWVPLAEADANDLIDVLLGNVFTHTGPGVAASVEVVDGGDSWVLVVADQGPGFPEGVDVLARGVTGGAGSGLGLDIARSLAERAGGGLAFDNNPGARVRVTLPRVAGPR